MKKLSPPIKVVLLLVVIFAISLGYALLHKSEAASADVNSDGTVDIFDLSILASNWNKTGQTFAQGDINGDGIVNILDLSVLASQWGAANTCTGVNMTNGQTDINNNPSGTTFCLSGTHNWTLTPKSGDSFIGPAILDGTHTTQYAILGNGTSNVTLSNLEVRNYYANANSLAAIAGHGTTNWKFLNLQVHDNGTSGQGGTGAELGAFSQVVGGRYYNNRHLGIGGGGGAHDWVINGAEIDHNNFTDDTYTTRDTDCGWEAGGVKYVAYNITIENSKVHDNACKGIWSDINANNNTIINNQVYNNWDEGIFMEISSNGTISGNTVYGNGLKDINGCTWLWSGGITLAASDHFDVHDNIVYGNCNPITGIQQTRTDGNPGLLEFDSFHDNQIYATTATHGITGVVSDNGSDLSTRNITFTNNHYHLSNLTGNWFEWKNSTINKTTWVGYGNDTTGTFDTNTTVP